MSIGTAIFIVGMSALALVVVGAAVFARFWRREQARVNAESERINAEIEETRQSIRDGGRPTKGRFRLP